MKRPANANVDRRNTRKQKPDPNAAATKIQQWWKAQLSPEEDPISLQRFPRKYAIELNKQQYNRRVLLKGGVTSVPHTRRPLTPSEKQAIGLKGLAEKIDDAVDHLLVTAKGAKDVKPSLADNEPTATLVFAWDPPDEEVFGTEIAVVVWYFSPRPKVSAERFNPDRIYFTGPLTSASWSQVKETVRTEVLALVAARGMPDITYRVGIFEDSDLD